MKITTIISFIMFLITITSFSQIGIGTSTPKGILDVTSTTNGVLLPRVALTSTSTALPVVNPNSGALVAGTLVWNTATAGSYPNNVKPGYYYWSGTKWISVVTSNTINLGLHSNSTLISEPSVTGLESNNYVSANSLSPASVDLGTLSKPIVRSGAVGTITNITCNLKFNALETLTDVFAYLKSPTGQIINLKYTEGGTSYNTFPSTTLPFDVTYSDAGLPMPMTEYNSSTGITGTYAPYGDMTVSNTTLPSVTPTISTMSGFNGFSPNGTWTLYFKDEYGGIVSNFVSATLYITTNAISYRLVAESDITNINGNKIFTNSTYSANCVNDAGFITALTRTTVSAGAIGTTVTTLPGSILSYSSDSPKVGAGNYWASTSNLGVSTSLTNGVTYFYQLWVKGNIDTPTVDNERFYIAPFQMP